MKPAMTDRAALPVHSTKSSVTGAQPGGGVNVQRMLRMARRAGHEHQIPSFGSLHHHGRHNGHQHAPEGIAPGVVTELFERIVTHAFGLNGFVVARQQVRLMAAPIVSV